MLQAPSGRRYHEGRCRSKDVYHEMGAALREGKVDLFMDSVFPAMAMVRLADAGWFSGGGKRCRGRLGSSSCVRTAA